VPLHAAEIRGYRELYVTGRQLVERWKRLGDALEGSPAEDALRGGAASVREMLDELEPLTERHGLHSRVTAQGTGARVGSARSAILDRFLERNQALRLAVGDLEHVVTLVAYLATLSDGRGHPELAELCRPAAERLASHAEAVRRSAVELGTDPDAAIEPLDPSPVGRAAHRGAWAAGAIGEWIDRQTARRRRSA
jgi:hypothetical protein